LMLFELWQHSVRWHVVPKFVVEKPKTPLAMKTLSSMRLKVHQKWWTMWTI